MDDTIAYNKAKFFMDKDLAVHISKTNNWFHNGKIISIESDFLILIDEREGELPIFFKEIFEIEKRESKNETNEM